MDNNAFLRIEDLVTNPTPRVPICLCLDTSGSMQAVEEGSYVSTGKKEVIDGEEWEIVTGGTSRLDELQKGIQLFYDAINEDEVAVYSAEICVVTFDDTAKCLVDFSNINRQSVPKLQTANKTSLGEGVTLALDLLEKRKREYQEKGVDYYQPWLVLMTDGIPNGNASILRDSIERTVSLVKNKKLTIFPIGIGKDADMSVLQQFSPNRTPLRLQGLKFKEFFEWLSKSVSRTSNSVPGESVPLDVDGLKGWASLD